MPISMTDVLGGKVTPQPGDIVSGRNGLPYKYVGGDPRQSNLTNYQPLTGPEFLQHINPNDASLVQGILDGRKSWPGGFGTRSPYWIKRIQFATQADPNFDETKYKARIKMRDDLAANSPNSLGGNTRAINTAIGHLGTLATGVSGLANTDLTWWNYIRNQLGTSMGEAAPVAWDTQRSIVATDVPKAIRGGMINEADIDRQYNNLARDNSFQQKRIAIKKIVDALASRINENRDAWRTTMGPNAAHPNFLSPQSQRILKALDVWFQTGMIDPKLANPDSPLDMHGFGDEMDTTPASAFPHQVAPAGAPHAAAPMPAVAPPQRAWPKPPPQAIIQLRMQPNMRGQFDEVFGPGASAQALGH